MNKWRSLGILVVAGGLVALTAISSTKRSPRDGEVGSYKEIVKRMQESAGEPRPKQTDQELGCAKHFAAENEEAKREAQAVAAHGGKSPPAAEARNLQKTFAERMRERELNDAMLDRLPLEALVGQAAPEDLELALLRRIWAKERRHGPGALTQPERTLDVLEIFSAEVNNGGFHQYFFNSSGDRAIETRQAIEKLGVAQLLGVFDCALTAFPSSTPSSDRVERNAQLDAWGDRQFDLFEPLDDAFYRLGGELRSATSAYVREQFAGFDLPPIR